MTRFEEFNRNLGEKKYCDLEKKKIYFFSNTYSTYNKNWKYSKNFRLNKMEGGGGGEGKK